MPHVTALVVHSGGPTAVINASLAGIVEEARRLSAFGSLLGARHGIDGLLGETFVDLSAVDPRRLASVAQAPGSALGSSRRAVTDADLDRALAVCRARDIRVLFYTGGNGSMETAHRLATLARAAGQALAVVGVPKTIDNDLTGTDHAPGYGSAARFFACAARDIAADNRALPDQVQVLEVLGRNAGWIAAATDLVPRDPDAGPHLIYLPERPLPSSRLLDDVQHVFDRLHRCVVVVCEGQLDEQGGAFGADVRVSSRGTLATNLGHCLARLITRHLGLKARAEKPGLFGRSSAALRSEVDWREARLCGEAAVRAAVDGVSGVMVGLDRSSGEEYAITTRLVPLERVAGVQRLFPLDWIDDGNRGIQPAFHDYAAPIVGSLEPAAWLG